MESRNLTALLATLAMVGWQNRDKLGELIGTMTGQRSASPSTGANTGVGTPGSATGGLGGLFGGLFGAGGGGQALSGGLGDLLNSFTGGGQADVADSWVRTGPNKEIDEPKLAAALGSDTVDQLVAQTGLSRDELLSRLKSVLPTAVDKLTPQGRLPTEEETSQWQGSSEPRMPS